MDKYRRQLTKKEEPHSPGEEEHIVKMWTPLHFCTPVGDL